MLCVSESFVTLFLSMRPAPKVQTRTLWKHQKPYVLVSNLPDGLSDRWNRKVQEIRRSYGREPCLLDFLGYVNEETILVNDTIFLREAVQEYVMHPDKKLNKVKRYEVLLLVRPRKFSRYVLCVTANTI